MRLRDAASPAPDRSRSMPGSFLPQAALIAEMNFVFQPLYLWEFIRMMKKRRVS